MSKARITAIFVLFMICLALSFMPELVTTSKAATDTNWNLVATRSVKAYPSLQETFWQKNVSPYGSYDTIGLHRLIKTVATVPKGVVIMVPEYSSSGEEYASNPPTDNWTKLEYYTQSIYWANRGFDVYALDYRTHFVPNTLNSSQLSFMKDWGWDMYVSDLKEAVDKVKEVSGATKVYMAGFSQGSGVVMNYAAKYWKQDLQGIILESSYLPSYIQGPFSDTPVASKRGNETNNFNLPSELNAITTWSRENLPLSGIQRQTYALNNPGAPAEYPPGTPLTPTINPATNKPWANITEWNTFYWSNMSSPMVPGVIFKMSNANGGYGNITEVEHHVANGDRWVPVRSSTESRAMVDWVNCPYLTYDYDDHYKEVNVPLISFDGQLYLNASGKFRYVNGIGSTDFTGVMLKDYAHYDIMFGPYSARDVSEPILQWMIAHQAASNQTPKPSTPLAASAFDSVTIFSGQRWYFYVHSNGGVGNHSYQWYEGSTAVAGQTDAVLVATKATPGTYTYYCKVTDSTGATANSNAITLTVR